MIWSKKEKLLFTSGLDYTCILWDVSNGQMIHQIVSNGYIKQIAVDFNEQLLAVYSTDKILKVFDQQNSFCIRESF